jgi:hypothetical protein
VSGDHTSADESFARTPVQRVVRNETGREEGDRRWWVFPLIAYLVSRLLVLMLAEVSTWVRDSPSLPSLLTSWDGQYYLRIAEQGYPARLADRPDLFAFFPGYPMLVRLVDPVLPGSVAGASLILAFVLGALATLAVWLMARDVVGPASANVSVLLLVFFPTGTVLSMAYAEGLLVLAAALTLWAIRRELWWLAGGAALVAGTARMSGAVVVGVCGLAALVSIWRCRTWKPVPAVALPAIGIVSFMWFEYSRTGDAIAFVHQQALWKYEFRWFTPVFTAVVDLASSTAAWRNPYNVMGAAALTLFIAGLAAMWRERRLPIPWEWWVVAVGMGVVALTPGQPVASLRYLLPALPMFVAVASVVHRWKVESLVVAGSATLMGGISVGYFVGWTNIASGFPSFHP